MCVCTHLCVHVYVHICMFVLGRQDGVGRHDPSVFWLIERKGVMGMGRGLPVSHVKEGQHRPLPQAQAFICGNMPDHPALLLPSSVLHQHQGDVSPKDSLDEPGHSEL